MSLAPGELKAVLQAARTIAVVGLSPKPHRPSHQVASYLQEAGYRIIPVRPGVSRVLGEPAFPDLRSAMAAGPIDIIDIFRRSEMVEALVEDCVAVKPRLVWMQVGVVAPRAAERLEAAGVPVVMDRCLKVDHYHLLMGD